ncbi:uncharacterized protein LOC144130231 isoform X2 [Amblyomma americanum]
MTATSTDSPLPAYLLDLRENTLNKNGIHTIYPQGQTDSLSYGYFNAFSGFTLRSFSYVVHSGMDWSVYSGTGYVIMKFYNDNPFAVLKGNSGVEFTNKVNEWLYAGLQYSFAIRAVRDGSGTHFQAIYNDKSFEAVKLDFWGCSFSHVNQSGAHNVRSTHFCDDDSGSEFPTDDGLDNFLPTFVRFDVGSYLLYTGIYQGNGPIKVHKPHGAVPDLQSPPYSGRYVRVGVRVTTRHFVFNTDYGGKPVVVPFKDLQISGFHFVPRFEKNFNVRHVLIESNRYYP